MCNTNSDLGKTRSSYVLWQAIYLCAPHKLVVQLSMELDSVRNRHFESAISLLQFGWPSRANRSAEPVQSSHEMFPGF